MTKIKSLSKEIQIFEIIDFLDNDSCNELCKLILGNNCASATSDINNSNVVNSFRTSKTSHFIDSPLIKKVNVKIERTLGIHQDHGEFLQGQLYDMGNEFKAHTDFFQPDTTEYETHCNHVGNRTWTFMIYLNTVTSGGNTYFPNIDLSISPVRGKAIVWNNLNFDGTPNYDTLHCGEPVLSGSKYVITKWFRESTKNKQYSQLGFVCKQIPLIIWAKIEQGCSDATILLRLIINWVRQDVTPCLSSESPTILSAVNLSGSPWILKIKDHSRIHHDITVNHGNLLIWENPIAPNIPLNTQLFYFKI
jgi:prolyl 4-hydroxylase